MLTKTPKTLRVLAALIGKLQDRLDRTKEDVRRLREETGDAIDTQRRIIGTLRQDNFAQFGKLIELANKAIDQRDAKHSTREQINTNDISKLAFQVANATVTTDRVDTDLENLTKRHETLTDSVQYTLDHINKIEPKIEKLYISLQNEITASNNSFQDVAKDIKALTDALSRMNARVSKLEGVSIEMATRQQQDFAREVELQAKVAKLESPLFSTDTKFSAFYIFVNDLHERLIRLERGK